MGKHEKERDGFKAGQDLSLPASDLPLVWGISGDFLTWYQTGVV